MPSVSEYVAVRAYLRGFPMLTTSSLFRQEGKGGEGSQEICLVSRHLKKNCISSFLHFDCQRLFLPPPSLPVHVLLLLFLYVRLLCPPLQPQWPASDWWQQKGWSCLSWGVTNGKEDIFLEIIMAPHYCNTLLKATQVCLRLSRESGKKLILWLPYCKKQWHEHSQGGMKSRCCWQRLKCWISKPNHGERHHLLRHGSCRVQTIQMVPSVRVAGKKAEWPQHLIVV